MFNHHMTLKIYLRDEDHVIPFQVSNKGALIYSNSNTISLIQHISKCYIQPKNQILPKKSMFILIYAKYRTKVTQLAKKHM